MANGNRDFDTLPIGSAMTKTIYVDDHPNSPYTKMITELLTVAEMECELRGPPHDLAEVANWELDILLIDYDLASATDEGKLIGYSGNSLATELRNRQPFCPIVLVSRENKLSGRSSHLTTGGSDVDLILYKDKILQDKQRALHEILVLHEGYMQLEAIQKQPWSEVLDQLGAEEEEQRKIREAFPPIGKGHRWYVPATIEWIRTVLMGYPGILYDSLHASARLGINEASFASKAVQEIFADAKYKGPLAGFGERWWSDRLVGIATRTIIDANVEGPISEGFAEAYALVRHQKLERARCVVDRKPIADQICYILRQPVKRENSIIYYPDSRPPIMDTARVSLEGIVKDEFDEALVEASSVDVVREVWDNDQP